MSEEPIRVRRKSQQPFAMVPHAFARDGSLGDKAFRLWIVLQSHADFDDRDCKLFQSTLGTQIGGSQRTVARAQDELVRRGLLEVESGRHSGSPNIYVLVDNPSGVGHPCLTPSATRDLPPKTPMSYKENENLSNKKEPLSPGALRPWKRPGPTDFSDAASPEEAAANLAEIRESLKGAS